MWHLQQSWESVWTLWDILALFFCLFVFTVSGSEDASAYCKWNADWFIWPGSAWPGPCYPDASGCLMTWKMLQAPGLAKISEDFFYSLTAIVNTYNPLLQLFPEDFELLKLQHPRVVHLDFRQGLDFAKCWTFIHHLTFTPFKLISNPNRGFKAHFPKWMGWRGVSVLALMWALTGCLIIYAEESVSDVEGYVHQVDNTVAGAES